MVRAVLATPTVVVHPGGDAGAVIDHDELLGEVFGVGRPGLLGEVDEQSAKPVAVRDPRSNLRLR
jgi:hypothetical protein